ncbi:MAG: Tol-Pal system beta propeller repeat protein TolB [Alphaproteobacteria bacterium]
MVLTVVLILAALPAKAQLELDVRGGTTRPLNLALPMFAGEGEAESYGQNIAGVIEANLTRSGLFRILNRGAYIPGAEGPDGSRPRFADWRIINTEGLVSGKTTIQPDGRLSVEFRLWDVAQEKQLIGQAFATPRDNWRRIAHMISDLIYKEVTGESGYFDTRIVYIAESGPFTRRVKRLAIMDQDGANHKYLTRGRELILTPRFSPAAQQITYLAYTDGSPTVYLFDIQTGRTEKLGEFPNMTFAPRFSPDGNKVIFSMEKGGDSEIFTLDLRTRVLTQMTRHGAIDTAPSYSPDGERVVFESDRGGTQQHYVMRSNGSGEPTRISFGDGRYGTPVWSPRGDLIAFTKMLGGKFYIGVMRPDGSDERLLVTSRHVEGPSWAPNGRVLTYFKETLSAGGQDREARLYSIDLTGFHEKRLDTPGKASDPAWSPLLSRR